MAKSTGTYAIKRATFNFGDDAKMKAAQRQGNRCAGCGQNLAKLIKAGDKCSAHHLIPAQCGDINSVTDKQFLTSAENCVWLCEDCHFEVGHTGNFATGAIMIPRHYRNFYPFAFGTKSVHSDDFGKWIGIVNEHFKRKFK